MAYRIIDNGVSRPMTPDEEAEYLASTQEQPAEPTPEEQVAELKEQLAAFKILMGADE